MHRPALPSRELCLRAVFAALAAMAPALIAHWILASPAPVLPVVIPAGIGAGALAVPRPGPGRRNVAAAIAALCGACLVGLFVFHAVIIPQAAYPLWFDRLEQGRPGGAVSTVFVMASAALAVGPAGLAASRPARGIAGPVVLYLSGQGVLVAIARTVPWAGLAAAVPAALLVAIGARRTPLAALSLAAPAAALALLLIPLDRPRSSQLVDTVLAPALRRFVVDLVPDYPLVFSVPGYGEGQAPRALGRRPILTAATVFAVERRASGPVYLRSSVFYRYAGSSWGAGSPAGKGSDILRRAVDSFSALSALGRRLSRPGGDEPDLRLEVRTELYEAVPHTAGTVAYRINRGAIRPVTEAMRATGIRLAEPLSFGDVVELYEMPPARGAELFGAVEIVGAVPDRVRSLAQAMGTGRGVSGPQELMTRIVDEVAARAVYDLDTSAVEEGGDLVDTVLFETGRGYCVHFATSVSVLAALAGLPVRYVSGHVARPPATGFAQVTGYASHAWVEWYTPDGYWKVVEATPPLASPQSYPARGDDFTDRQLRAILGLPEPRETPRSPAGGVSGIGVVVLALVGLGGLGAVLLGVHRRRSPSALVRRCRALVGALESEGLATPEEIGWRLWVHRAGELHPGLGGPFFRLGSIVEAVFYGGREQLKRDSSFAGLLARAVRRRRRHRRAERKVR